MIDMGGVKVVKICRHWTLLLLCFVIQNTVAEPLDLEDFSIELSDGWAAQIESTGTRNTITLLPESGKGKIMLLAYSLPYEIDRDRLRLLTNVNFAIELNWSPWGNSAGFDYSYVENRIFYKQWWLGSEHAVLFITYSAETETGEVQQADAMVSSIEML